MLVCVFFAILHARRPVQRAPGIPCALCNRRTRNSGKPRAKSRGEIAKPYLPSLRGAKRRNPLLLRGSMDCFAEPVIGLEGETRWRGMTRPGDRGPEALSPMTRRVCEFTKRS